MTSAKSSAMSFVMRPHVAWAILVLAVLFATHAFAVGASYSAGARSDFEKYHHPAIVAYAGKPLERAVVEQRAASGPLSYLLLSRLSTDRMTVRVTVFTLFLASAGLLYLVQAGRRVRSPALITTAAFLLSPFNVSLAAWAHPEVPALFCSLLALLLLGRHDTAARPVGAVVLALAGLARQTFFLLPAALAIAHVTGGRRDWRAAAMLAAPSAVAAALLLVLWGGIVPPAQQHLLRPTPAAAVTGFAMFALYLAPARLITLRSGSLHGFLVAFVLLAASSTIIWLTTPPVTAGGFIFSRLDALLPLSNPVGAPLLAAAAIAFALPVMRQNLTLTLIMLLYCIGLGLSSVIYLKYVDSFIFAAVAAQSVLRSGGDNRQLALSLLLAEGGLLTVSLLWE